MLLLAALLGALLLLWQGALQILARGLGSRAGKGERLLACLAVCALCLPWLKGPRLFLPLDEAVANNIPDLDLPADPDRHGAYNDVVFQLYPWEAEVRVALREGRPPFWSDLLDGGSSPWTNPQAAVLAPTALLARLGPLEHFFLLHFALKALTAWLGALVLGRLLGLRGVARGIAGASFGLGGGIVSWSLFSLGTVVAWTPWLAAAAVAIVRHPRRRVFVTASLIAAAILLSGHPEAVLAAGLVSLTFALAVSRTSWRRRLARIGAFAACCLLGAALAAPAFLPQTLQMLRSLRAARAAERAAQTPAPTGFEEKLFLAPLNPEVFGRAFHDRSPIAWPVAGSSYLGVLAILGLPAAFLTRRKRRIAGPLVALAVLIYLAAADFAPLARIAAGLPYVNAIALTRWLPAAGLCLVLAGALGLESIFRKEIARRTAAVSALIPMAAILLLAQPPRLPAVLALALAALFVRARPARWVLLAAVLLDLIPWAWDYLPDGHREMLYPVTPFVQTVREHARVHPDSRVTAAGFLVYPSILPVYGLAEVRVDNPVADIRYLRVLDAALGFRPEGRRYKGALTNVDSPLLRFLGVSVLISSRHAPKPRGWTRLDHNEFAPMRLFEDPDPLPRWFLPTGAVLVPPGDPWEAVAGLEDPRRVVLSSEEMPGWRPPERPWDPGAVRWTGGRGRLRLEFPGDGWKLVASSIPYSEGWRAEARGRRLRTVPVNAAFLGVLAGPGTGAAEVFFEPPGFRAGLALCAAALLLGAGLGVQSALRSRISKHDS
ncbi:MAG: hypothetical protein ACJ76Y_31475 [Thermoanaerobaculia bacterium]